MWDVWKRLFAAALVAVIVGVSVAQESTEPTQSPTTPHQDALSLIHI
jgi:hypothetical protein